jgi:hypothetical protein
VGELTCLESISGGASDIAIEISHALDVSLSEIQARYFRDSDESDEVEWDLATSSIRLMSFLSNSRVYPTHQLIFQLAH